MAQLNGSGMFIERIEAAGFRRGSSTPIQNVFGITVFEVSVTVDNLFI